jgi:hypothetical protein
MSTAARAPRRVLKGSNTLISICEQLATFGDELYVAEGNGLTRGILVFPITANGNVSPTRTIAGSSTGLTGPLGVFVFF